MKNFVELVNILLVKNVTMGHMKDMKSITNHLLVIYTKRLM